MDYFNSFKNQKKISFKESIKNYLIKNQQNKNNLTITKTNFTRDRYKIINKINDQNNLKIPSNANKLMMQSFHKKDILSEFINDIKTKKSYSIKLKQEKNNKIELKNNSINFKNYNLSLKKRDKIKNQNNQTIDVNASSDIHFKKNNLFLSFNKNIKKENDQNKYFKTLDSYSKETLNTNHNNNYINNIINININLDKKRKKYRNELSLTLKNTINYVTENIFNNINNNGKNIKLNFHLKNKNHNYNNTSSFKSIKSDRGAEHGYIHTINNEIINNNKVRSKNTFLKLLSKNKNKKTNYIPVGRLIMSSENKGIKKFNENNLKLINNNILLKAKNSNKLNQKLLLLNNINPIINYNSNNKKIKKKKNFFKQKKKSDELNMNKIENYNLLRINTNQPKFINFVNSPKEQGIKLFLKTPGKFNNYINYKPEYVQEYNQEILLNLLMDEFCFNKKIKLTLSSELLNNYGINPSIRSYLIDSLIDLQNTFKFHNKTLFITLKLFDNYLSSIISSKFNNIIIKESELDLVLTSCFLIASKSEESYIYHLTDYLSILSSQYIINDLITMEYNILKYFNFEAFSPNVLDFFEFFSVFFNLDKSLNQKGIIILIIILSDLYLSQLPPSFLAFSVICILLKNYFNFDELINKLDNIFDNLYEDNNISINKDIIYEKFLMLLKPIKNEIKVKYVGERIVDYIKNINKDELINIKKKMELFNNLI